MCDTCWHPSHMIWWLWVYYTDMIDLCQRNLWWLVSFVGKLWSVKKSQVPVWLFGTVGLIVQLIFVPDGLVVWANPEFVRVTGYTVCCIVCVPVNCAEDESNAFFSKYERLLNLCLLVLEGGGYVMMPGIQVYGWPKGVSIIHKVRPLNAAWRQIDLAKEARWQTDHFIRLLESQITSQCCCTQSDQHFPGCFTTGTTV